MKVLLLILLVVVVLYLIDFGIWSLKSNNAYKNHIIIIDAICAYNRYVISEYRFEDVISYNSMESYEETIRRWRDWGYKNIVPPDVLEKITPFIVGGADNER